MGLFGNQAPGGMPSQMRRDINMLRPPMQGQGQGQPYGMPVTNPGWNMSGPAGNPTSRPSIAGSGQGLPPLPRGRPPVMGQNGQPPGMGAGTGFGGGLFGGLFRRLMQGPQMQQS